MKYLPLIFAGLTRKPTRSVLTLLSTVVAFLLFGLLQGVNAGYGAVIEAQHLDRLLTDPRVPGGAPMPRASAEKIKQIPGVTRVCARSAFLGYYQDPKNGLFALATDAADWFAVRPEFAMESQQLAVFNGMRTAIAMTPALMRRLHLKLGDKVPVTSPISRKDGNPVWTFELIASFDATDEPETAQIALINYSYFDEARATDISTVDRIIVRIADPTRSAYTAAAIDALFANSANETRTQNEKEQTESQIRQVGDIAYFTNAIVAAVFFALLFVTGNTMVQSVRERIPEFAVLKTLGFTSMTVFGIVVAEAAFLCLIAAVLGLGFASALFSTFKDSIGLASISLPVVVDGLLVALVLAFASSLIPAWKAQRLRIVEALRVR
ncbi:MAG: ABC transporter permease [Povalibacter sp.]